MLGPSWLIEKVSPIVLGSGMGKGKGRPLRCWARKVDLCFGLSPFEPLGKPHCQTQVSFLPSSGEEGPHGLKVPSSQPCSRFRVPGRITPLLSPEVYLKNIEALSNLAALMSEK